MIKRFSLIFLIFMSVNAHAAETVTVAADEWAPYVFNEEGTVKSFDYEVMKTVFSRLGYRVEFKFMPWTRCLRMVEHAEIDAILDAGIIPERMKTMYFPDEKISDSISVLFHLKGKNMKFNTLNDLRGLRIGTIRGYTYSPEVDAADVFTKEPVNSIEQNLKKLEIGRIDMFISNLSVGLYTIRKHGYYGKVVFLPKPVSGGALYVSFARTERNKKLANDFSTALRLFKTTDEYREIMKRYEQ